MPKEPLDSRTRAKLVYQGLVSAMLVGGSIFALLVSKSIAPVPKDLPWFPAVVFAAVGTIVGAYTARATDRRQAQQAKEQEARIEKAESRAEAEPEKAKFAWDLARVKLEAYFDRNLSQVNQIFYFALVVMFVGFGFIMWAVWLSIGQPKITPTSIVASSAGIISQFIGATFMLIYRSTMSQANSFMHVLERINTVGMSMQILDSVPEGELKNKTRAEMIDVLLNTNVRFRPRESKIAKRKAIAREE